MDERDRRTSAALIALAATWPLALASAALTIESIAPVALLAGAVAVAMIALVEAVRRASTAVAARSWSRPGGASEVSRRAIGSSVAAMLVFALLPVLGFLSAFGFDETTAQVESRRVSYMYRIDYGELRSRLRRTVVVIAAESTIAAIAILVLSIS